MRHTAVARVQRQMRMRPHRVDVIDTRIPAGTRRRVLVQPQTADRARRGGGDKPRAQPLPLAARAWITGFGRHVNSHCPDTLFGGTQNSRGMRGWRAGVALGPICLSDTAMLGDTIVGFAYS